MRTRFLPLPSVLALAICAFAACAATVQAKSIDPALLAKAQAGDAAALVRLGNAYNYGRHGAKQDYAQALIWYRKGAEQGDANSQFQLGGLYHFGHGVPQDDAQGFAWIMKAAEQGHIDAEFFISVSYTQGWGVTSDAAQSAVWLRKAAEQGDARSQFYLGVDYEKGEGVAQDYSEAYYWFELAASVETKRGMRKRNIKKRDEAASHLSSAELDRLDERVQRWIDNYNHQT